MWKTQGLNRPEFRTSSPLVGVEEREQRCVNFRAMANTTHRAVEVNEASYARRAQPHEWSALFDSPYISPSLFAMGSSSLEPVPPPSYQASGT